MSHIIIHIFYVFCLHFMYFYISIFLISSIMSYNDMYTNNPMLLSKNIIKFALVPHIKDDR